MTEEMRLPADVDAQPLVRAAAVLQPVIRKFHDEIERGQRMPPALFGQLREAGFYKMVIPRSLGGLQVDPLTYLRVIETLAEGAGSVGWNLGNGGVGQLVTLGLPDDGVDEIYGKRADTVIAGTAVPGGGRAVPAPGGYRVSGRWQFGSGCNEASWMLGSFQVIGDDSQPLPHPDGGSLYWRGVFARADAEIVGSYDAVRWVPEAHVIPPGLDLRPFTPVPPSDSPRPLVVHAPSNREKKGTQFVIEACAELPVELDIVEGVPHDVARARYARADIVVDQLKAGWHGVFALEAMALGKPVVSHVKPDVVERSAAGFGIRVPIVPATRETLVAALRPLVEQPARRRELGAESRAYVEQVHDIDRIADRLIDLYGSLPNG